MGPDTYDLVSLLRDSYVDIAERELERADRLFPRAQGAQRRTATARVPAAVRSDGAAAQPEGARHVRLPDDDPPQPGLHPVHPADAAVRADQPRKPARVRAAAGAARAHVEEFR